ncbi:MAG: Uma2 family endonuclease, partial [Cytophagales bacterium]|nr:Uma2 family endonuclease [Cytophagales bacterium]
EILSLQNSKHDIKIKFELYQEAGVKEYWIVSPYEKVIDIFVLQNNKYVLVNKYAEDDKVPVHTLPGLEIDLTEVFDY